MSPAPQPGAPRRVALVTGVGRRAGIGAAVVERLAVDGLDVAFTWWSAYDERMPWGADDDARDALTAAVSARGVGCVAVEADLTRPQAPAEVFDAVEATWAPSRCWWCATPNRSIPGSLTPPWTASTATSR